jgi:hypothetical protein
MVDQLATWIRPEEEKELPIQKVWIESMITIASFTCKTWYHCEGKLFGVQISIYGRVAVSDFSATAKSKPFAAQALSTALAKPRISRTSAYLTEYVEIGVMLREDIYFSPRHLMCCNSQLAPPCSITASLTNYRVCTDDVHSFKTTLLFLSSLILFL